MQGVAAVRRIFAHMFETLDAPRFVVREAFSEGDQAFLSWDFHAGRFVIRGATHLRFCADGRDAGHRDYWDAAEELYEKLPVLGALMRLLRRKLAASWKLADEADMRWLRGVLLILAMACAAQARAADLISFWQRPQHGSNCFNEARRTRPYFKALRDCGATWVRLTFSKWSPPPARDFLYGSLDDYRALNPDDLAVLRHARPGPTRRGSRSCSSPWACPARAGCSSMATRTMTGSGPNRASLRRPLPRGATLPRRSRITRPSPPTTC